MSTGAGIRGDSSSSRASRDSAECRGTGVGGGLVLAPPLDLWRRGGGGGVRISNSPPTNHHTCTHTAGRSALSPPTQARRQANAPRCCIKTRIDQLRGIVRGGVQGIGSVTEPTRNPKSRGYITAITIVADPTARTAFTGTLRASSKVRARTRAEARARTGSG